MPFVGEYNHTLDTKNRVFIPSKIREQLGETFYITRKMDKECLAIYPEAEMALITEKLNQFPDSEVGDIKRFLYSKSICASPDSNGRVVLPPQILSYAQIEKNVVIVGVGNHVQIWAEHLWKDEDSPSNIATMRRKLASIGL